MRHPERGRFTLNDMRRERRTALRRWSAGSIVGGVLMGSLGLVLLLGDFMAMGAEDEVPLTMWLVPLVLVPLPS